MHRRRDAVRREDDRLALRHLVLVVDEDRAARLEVAHDVEVVDDLLAHVDGRPVQLERALDRLDRPLDARRSSRAARPGAPSAPSRSSVARRVGSPGAMTDSRSTVLVIDDEPAIRCSAASTSRPRGWRCSRPSTGWPASSVAQGRVSRRDPARRDDAGLDGWQVAEELLPTSERASIAIVFLTGPDRVARARASARDRARSGSLTKPVRPRRPRRTLVARRF